MVQGRQENEWPQIMALVSAVNNLFADKVDRVDIRKFIPQHLLRTPAKPQAREDTPEQAMASWVALRSAFKSGRVGGR